MHNVAGIGTRPQEYAQHRRGMDKVAGACTRPSNYGQRRE